MQGLTIRAECTIFHNNLQVNCKKKSKLATLQVEPKAKILIINTKGDNQIFKFPIQKLKTIHKKFVDEGKITIQFDGNVEGTVVKGVEGVDQNVKWNGNFQIFLSNACKENLEALISSISTLRRESNVKNTQPNNKDGDTQRKTADKKRKKSISPDEIDQITPNIPKKHIFSLITSQKSQRNPVKAIQQPKQLPKFHETLLTLPLMLIRNILDYSGVCLSYRLISKQMQDIILKSISNIKVKQQIDQKTFNKLAMWAINVEGKPKNVKTIKLRDKQDNQILQKNKAKTLKFGAWTTISAKHVQQLKGLRIYCLELPYAIKFDLSNIYGIRLVELRLKGKNVALRNSFVKEEQVLYIINNCKDLRVIEIAYATTKVLVQIKDPQKMQQIRIGTLNKTTNDEWANFKLFKNLKILCVQDTQKQGCSEDYEENVINATFPQNLRMLQLGFNITSQAKGNIPECLRFLKLSGQFFRNNCIDQFFLPQLQKLDIINCPNLSPECLQNMRNLKIATNWDRNRVDYANNYYANVNLTITSVRGFTYC